MSVIHIQRIEKRLDDLFGQAVDISDWAGRPEEQARAAFLSRALAAFALHSAAELPAEEAAKAVVDGFDDNGIDAFYFDTLGKAFYVVQSKWIGDGNGTISQGEAKKFLGGFRDLTMPRLERFNAKTQDRHNEIMEALLDASVSLKLILIHTGLQSLSEHVRRDIETLLEEMNNPDEVVSVNAVDQGGVYDLILGSDRSKISLEIGMKAWASVETPYRAFYGQVEAATVASWWEDHGRDLFARNLRHFKGRTDVNKGLAATLLTAPDHFWYFNNGITMLCSELRKKPVGGSSRDYGIFECEGVSVVNGAQTVGVIGTVGSGSNGLLSQVQVPLRLISLEDCPRGFDTAVTRATNTQNRIESRDFAALDPNQRRIANEFLLDERHYDYKSGHAGTAMEDGCTIVEATAALACATKDLAIAVQAKREIGRLWDNIEQPPYKTLFNESTTGLEVWRAVRIMRTVERRLELNSRSGRDREAMAAVHGNRFVLHCVFGHPSIQGFRNEKRSLSQFEKDAIGITDRVFKLLIDDLKENFPSAYLASLFKNQSRCREIHQRISPLIGSEVPEPSKADASGQGRLFPNYPL